MSNKVNPESAMLEQMDGKWQQLAAFILFKLAKDAKITVTAEDMKECYAMFKNEPVIFTHGHSDSIDFQLVTTGRAKALAEHDRTMRGTS